MASDRETEIEACLAYAIMRDPDHWIGCPSSKYLDVFLQAVAFRRDFAGSSVPDSRISGVLNEPAFSQQFVDATGHPTLAIRWATAIEMTDLSLAVGFAKLYRAAIDWHRTYGVITADSPGVFRGRDAEQFWYSFAKCPPLFMGDESGWGLYCFLNGMQKGGDWLGLAPMPRLDDIFGGIKRRSERSYGSEFAAFRVYDARGLLKWVNLPDPERAS